MVLLDTNILVYASNKSSSLFEKAKKIRDSALKGKLDACISLQNLSEFYSVITSSKRVEKPLIPQEAKREVEKYLRCLAIRKLTVKPSTVFSTMKLAEKYNVRKQNIYDAQIVAIMMENKVTRILTRNTDDFSLFREIEAENPFQES